MAWDDSPHMKTHGFQVSGEQASGELMKFAQITLAVTPTSDFFSTWIQTDSQGPQKTRRCTKVAVWGYLDYYISFFGGFICGFKWNVQSCWNETWFIVKHNRSLRHRTYNDSNFKGLLAFTYTIQTEVWHPIPYAPHIWNMYQHLPQTSSKCR